MESWCRVWTELTELTELFFRTCGPVSLRILLILSKIRFTASSAVENASSPLCALPSNALVRRVVQRTTVFDAKAPGVKPRRDFPFAMRSSWPAIASPKVSARAGLCDTRWLRFFGSSPTSVLCAGA
jgi:hypothetical protein